MKITIYSTTSSESSKDLKDYLRQNELVFEEKLIDLDESAKEEMEKETGGFMGVPFVVFLANGKKDKVVGFDRKKIDEILRR
jgi:glutaredoxin